MRTKKIFSVVLAAAMQLNSFIPVATFAAENPQSSDVVRFYNDWKEKYLVRNEYVTDEAQYYVYYSDEHFSGNGSVPVTVSEAHGYGMLIMASMAEYDRDAQKYFDGMFRYFKAHPSNIGNHLMSWQQCDNGKSLIDGAEDGSMVGGFCDSASDGDIDIAYSLLMADSIWGSDGEINYRSEAVDVINDIMKYDVNHEYWTINLGDWVSECEPSENYYSATRCSDFIVQYFPVFAEVTGNDDWLKVYDSTYSIINGFLDEYGTGFLPDFVVRDSDGRYIPSPADFLESENDCNYYYNSCRTPWRIGMDYLITGNEDSLRFAVAVSDSVYKSSNGNPRKIMAGYTPDGKAVEDYSELCFIAPLLIAAKCGDNSEWYGDIRQAVLNFGDDSYFGDTIKMLCLIVDCGMWTVPEAGKSSAVTGDVNADGIFSVADVVMMQKWLLAAPDATLTDWRAGDVCKDGIIDVFDMCEMRKLLVNDSRTLVSSSEELKNALANAKAGDDIVLSPGEYVYSGATPKGRMFTCESDGTESAPIKLHSLNPDDPAVISGTTTESNYALTITGDWWEVSNLVITNASKGIILDNSNHTVIRNCEVYNIGAEGIHFRDDSSYCTAEKCFVHDTGVVSPGYGEAVYVGSAKSTTGYGFDCHYNRITECRLGPNVAAEHIDVKEYTIGTVIEKCTFDGTGMSGENSSKSFVNVKGNDVILRDCVGYRNGCDKITRAFESNQVVDGWGQNLTAYGNRVYMDTPTSATGKSMYFLNAWDCTATVHDNYIAWDGELIKCEDEANRRSCYNCNMLNIVDIL